MALSFIWGSGLRLCNVLTQTPWQSSCVAMKAQTLQVPGASGPVPEEAPGFQI